MKTNLTVSIFSVAILLPATNALACQWSVFSAAGDDSNIVAHTIGQDFSIAHLTPKTTCKLLDPIVKEHNPGIVMTSVQLRCRSGTGIAMETFGHTVKGDHAPIEVEERNSPARLVLYSKNGSPLKQVYALCITAEERATLLRK